MTTDERLARIEAKLDDLLNSRMPQVSIQTKIAHGRLYGKSAEQIADEMIAEAKKRRKQR